jgi:type II secretory pathway component PulF
MPLLLLGRATAGWWAICVPAVLVFGAATWWIRSNSIRMMAPRNAGTRGWPKRWSIRRLGQAATLAEVLAMLIDRRTPLDKALPLAAETAGVASWRDSAYALAEQTRRGNTLSSARDELEELPPLIRLALLHVGGCEFMVNGLRIAGAVYRERARHGAEWLAVTLPTLLTVVIGGSAAAAYAAVVFWPYLATLYEMSGWY